MFTFPVAHFGGELAYTVAQSLRFNDDDSSHLSRTPGSAGNRKTWTFSAWVKRANLTGGRQAIFSANNNAYLQLGPDAASREMITILNEGTGTDLNWYTTQVFRDPAAWFHVVWQFDSTQASADNRTKLFINGSQVTDFTKAATPDQDFEGAVNNTVEHKIGEAAHAATFYLDAYLAEIHFIDGTAKVASDFGETNDDGVWIPKKYDGAYGDNGFFIDGRDSSDLGGDESGNGNDFTSNLPAADKMSDSPTLNAATFNPLWAGAGLSDGNLVATASGNAYQWATSTFSIDDGGKYACEFQKSSGTFGYVGIFQLGNHNATTGNNYMYGIQLSSGEIVKNSSVVASSGTVGVTPANSLMRIEYDGSNDTIKIFDDGAEIFPASTGVSNTVGLTGHNSLHFGCAPYASGTIITATFQGLNGTPTATFKELTSANLATPSITDGSAYFQATTYTGDGGGSHAINQAGNSTFEPSLVWIKSRSAATDHVIQDQVRGNFIVYPNQTSAQGATGGGWVGSFDNDGFTINVNGPINASGETFVGWQWKAAGSGSSNTDGSITSSVSADTTSGFSIVTYTGTKANATVGHGLGAVPKMIIIKDTTNTESWIVGHNSIGFTKNLYLNLTNAAATSSTIWQDTAPTSSVFTIGTSDGINKSSAGHVAYCFAEVEGYSSISSYIGNGSADGPYVSCDFAPAWLIVKRAVGGTGNWDMLDTKRDTFNPADAVLDADSGGAEASYSTIDFDFLSNGFKVRGTQSNINTSGDTYIYMAFAENPFGGDGVAPVTAR